MDNVTVICVVDDRLATHMVMMGYHVTGLSDYGNQYISLNVSHTYWVFCMINQSQRLNPQRTELTGTQIISMCHNPGQSRFVNSEETGIPRSYCGEPDQISEI